MNDCVTCDIFAQLNQLADSYGRQAFGLLAPSTRLAFNAFVGVWLAWILVVNGVVLGNLRFGEVFPRIAIFSLCGLLLTAVDFYWDWFYQPTYDAMNGIAVSLVAGDTTGVEVTDLPGMLAAVETQILQVMVVVKAVIRDAGITSLWLLAAGVVMAIPYVFVWGIFLAFVLEGIFKLLAVTAVSPLLIAAAAFRPSRGFAISGFRIILGGVLTVVFAAVAMGFTLHVMRFFIGQIPMGPDGFAIDIQDWVMSDKYFGILILGFVSVLFHLKAATLAANISGASDGPGAAAAVVAGGMTALATLKGVGVWGSRRAATLTGSVAGAIGNAGRENHDRIWRRPNTKIADSSSK
jgi:hypothetical protein